MRRLGIPKRQGSFAVRVVLALALAVASATSALTTEATDVRLGPAAPSTLRCTATVMYGVYGPSSYPKFNYVGDGKCSAIPRATLAVSYSVTGTFPTSVFHMLMTLTDPRTGAVTNLDEDFDFLPGGLGPFRVRGPNGRTGVGSFGGPYGNVSWVQTF